MKRPIWLTMIGCTLASLGFVRSAAATYATVPISYMTEDMHDYSTCDYPCNTNPSLSYSEGQIAMLNSKLQEVTGNNQVAWFANDAWSSDLGEDRDFNGQDYLYADGPYSPPILYAYSGHGGNPTDSNGRMHFVVPMCHNSSGFTGGWNGWACQLDVTNATRLGDYTGSYYGIPNPGYAAWAVLLTCNSVDVNPDQQWWDVFQGRFQYVCGYRGQSHDAESTEDTAANFANDAFVYHNYQFQATWFSAAGSFWYDDTAEVFTRGTSAADASYRLANYQASYFDDGSQNGDWWADAWHNACWDC